MDNWFDAAETRRCWPFASERPHPVICLRQLRLLSSLDAAEPIRSIPFHRGLNIIWADPKVQEARSGGPRLAGHSAGKTTLCRILRWLLGDAHFGPEETEVAVAVAFKDGWALLHLELDGQPWVVGRAFWNKSDHRAVHGTTLDDVQRNGWPESNTNDEFFAELTRLTLAPLVRQRFPGEQQDIDFTSLLGWLARDQEAALQRVDSWRSTTSGGNNQPAPDKSNRHILMRLVLGLLEDTEWDEMEKCAGFEAEKDTWKKKSPGLEASARAACEPLARLVGSNAEGLDGPLIISGAEQIVREKEARLKAFREQLRQIDVKKAQADFEGALAERAKGEKAVESARRGVNALDKKIAQRNGDLITAKQRERAKDRGFPPGYCARLREEVKGKCNFYTEVPESFAVLQTAAEIQQNRDHLQDLHDEAQQEFTTAQDRLPFLEANETAFRNDRNKAQEKREELWQQIAELEASLNADREVLLPAIARQKTFDECQSELTSLSDWINSSNETQRAIRQDKWRERNTFADRYRAALTQLTAKGAKAKLEFDSAGLFDLENSGSAVNALKVLAFDLAAMLWSASGKGHHPRLLIHDSPRVADMSPVPYSAVFDLVAAAEGNDKNKANFQYIITTTESPPEDLHEKHLILTLDGSLQDGLLFGRDFTEQ